MTGSLRKCWPRSLRMPACTAFFTFMTTLLAVPLTSLTAAAEGAKPGEGGVVSRRLSAVKAQSSAAAQDGLAASAALRAAVTSDNIMRHLAALQAIADENGGNRAAGTAGHEASVDYVAGQLREAGYQVRFETVEIPVVQETQPPQLMVAKESGLELRDFQLRTLPYSAAGSVKAPLRIAGHGCDKGDFARLSSGSIALVQRGSCSVWRKVRNAAAAGAAAVIVYDQRSDRMPPTITQRVGEMTAIPGVRLDHATGTMLAEALRRSPVTMQLNVGTKAVIYRSRNVIAETAVGDPEAVVLIGAHLDSVPEGPGINDNGTGAAAILEVARQISSVGIKTTSKLRFAFWTDEENEMLGSHHHADSLSPDGLKRIMAVLNFDMLGSANYGRFVYDGNGSASEKAGPPGSEWIERMFRTYFAAVGLSVAEKPLEDGSDHLSFVEHGVPVGGLLAGDGEIKSAKEAGMFGGSAGASYDPCYHEACDTLDAVNRTGLDELADAAAHGIIMLGDAVRD
ncbi:M20/M25/M40 family metallo-hydrolase [Skermanella mucosa]|uniref:M20/M25/M40 family metallo-hydrolase n=1 Tax=Skermanella mucosa TaxID=1789672 RepID=UPI001E3E0A31|nr:M20/M25/M40 family metallo-hydrolase [Skermanella mucosa]UEM21326.1 M20/M25/M40 family metallo-hydrolase [Skermanella mucosa]